MTGEKHRTETGGNGAADELTNLRAEVERLTRALAEARAGKSATGAGTGSDEKHFGREDAERIAEQMQEGLDDIEKQIDAHPVPSVLVAFGIGFLLGKLLTR